MTIDRQTAKDEIKRRTPELLEMLLEHAKEHRPNKPQYVCPFCGHGRGGDGLLLIPGSTELKCFGGSCSFNHGDIIKLYQDLRGKNVYETLNDLADLLRIDIAKGGGDKPKRNGYNPDDWDEDKPAASNPDEIPFDGTIQKDEPAADAAATSTPAAADAPEASTSNGYMDYYETCRNRLDDPAIQDYLAKRGITFYTAFTYYLGYDPAADPASAPGGNGKILHPAQRLIIPVTKDFYVGRRIDGGKEFAKVNSKGGKIGIWNINALWRGAESVFVCEGAIDALSVCEAGYTAIGLNSASNIGLLVQQLWQRPTKAALYICLDNDAAGQKAAASLLDQLGKIGVSAKVMDICCGCKDPNEALVADRAAFKAAIAAATSARPDNDSNFIDTQLLKLIGNYKDAIPTGYAQLDKLTGGGLFPGLYFLAAISSLGKTTFISQMADQIAASGHDVLFFSLEQSKLELVSKSLAREIALDQRTKAADDNQPEITSLDIRRGYYGHARDAAISRRRSKIGDRLTTVDGVFSISVDTIKLRVQDYINRTGAKPIVFVDYLQILEQSEDDKKQRVQLREAIDHNVKALKVFSGEAGITIFCVASVNRMSYLTPIDFEALKESGGIEYSADVVFGLQLQCVHGKDFKYEDRGKVKKREIVQFHKYRTPRLVELVSLKNRFAKPGGRCYFEYYPAQELFITDDAMTNGSKKDKKQRKAQIAAEFEEWKAAQDVDADLNMEWDDPIEKDEEPASKRKTSKAQPAASKPAMDDLF